MVIPDLVLFVNGIPLVVMEAKSPTLLDVWKTQAVQQLRRYQEAEPQWSNAGAPALFHYNLLCVAHCGAGAAFSTLYAPENAYAEWKTTLPYTERETRERFGVEPQGQARLIVGLLSPATLLDILRDYVVFEPEGGRLVKKLPRYQQYRAVTAALQRLAGGRRPEERGGVIWHTQGSGKSLTMLWLATKLRREPGLNNPTIVVVTDRRQLDDQIARTFERCGFPAPEQANSGRELRRLLSSDAGRTVMTTIQKFEEASAGPDGEGEALNTGDNIVVMVDEAHRTQYGQLGAKLSRALPNAALVGFTGTPIDKSFRRSTMRRFGPLIDAYTIRQSVQDGATVEILYEARLPDLAIQGAETLDKLFDTLFSEATEAEKERIKKRYANRESVAVAEQRIRMIALDIAEHYKTRVKPNGFKAQVVAPNRLAAMRYARFLNDFHVRAYPIITTSSGDGSEYKEAMELDQGQVTGSFKNPDGEPEVLVVVDMLLTGFDAPVEQALYLDRGLQEHGLLQAVARVNRPFTRERDGTPTEKGYGLVVDYYGVSRNLEAALQIFELPEVMGAMRELEEDPTAALEAAATAAESHFKGRDTGDVWDCIAAFAPDAGTEGNFKADGYERFNVDYRDFSRLLDRAIPNPKALPYLERLARLTVIRAYVRAHFLQEDARLNWTDIGAKVKQLIDERISADVRDLMRPVSVLAQDFDQKIAALPHDEARASVMEHTIRAYINERLADNPVFYGKLSEQLERIILDLRNKVIDAAQSAKLQAALKAQLEAEEDVAAELGLSSESFAIYEIIGQGGGSSGSAISEGERAAYHARMEEEQKEATERVESAVEQHRAVVDWQTNPEVQRLMRRDIKRALRDGEKYSEDELDDLANRIVDAFRSRSLR